MTEISASKLDEIEAGLEGVTKGPWRAGSNGYNSSVFVMAGTEEVCEVFDDSETSAMPQDENAAHIARLDPDTVRSLVSLARKAQDYESLLRDAGEALEPMASVGASISGAYGAALFKDDEVAFGRDRGGCVWRENDEAKKLTWADFRRARTTLAKIRSATDGQR